MANQRHLNLLRQEGIGGWNTWRGTHPDIYPDLRKADLSGANLIIANLSGADLGGADLGGAELTGASLSGADLSGVNLSEANLIMANLSGANLREANLDEAVLSGASLIRAVLREANLSRANLSRADHREANLSGASLIRADLSGAYMSGTSLGDQDLRTTKGLETIQHSGPSPLSINTIYRSQGDIPEAFVRGTGAPDSFLEYMKALASKPIDYYTCFLSYSSRDQDFVEQLYANLQSKGVRCWFAPHDLRPGDFIRDSIDEAIRLYDKLVIILSQHSVESTWVRFEVEAALEKEVQRNTLVLFPLRLDESVMTTTRAWAASLRRERHIGDFTQWKHHDHYRKALTRLFRDLQPDIKPSNKP